MAAVRCLDAYYNEDYSADVRRGIRYAFYALAQTTPVDSELSFLFKIAAETVPVSRRFKYQNVEQELEERFSSVL